MICPKCGSNHVLSQAVSGSNTETKTKGFGCIRGCLGYLLFNIPGILCGMCGMGKGKTKTSTWSRIVHVCQDCGYRF